MVLGRTPFTKSFHQTKRTSFVFWLIIVCTVLYVAENWDLPALL